jgi:WD40-like Beta Propeller Repeat
VKLRPALAAATLVALCLLAPGSASAALPGTNGKIAFVSHRDGNPEIYTMNPDGTNVTRLTNHSGGDDDPAWSPDGKRIAFVRSSCCSPTLWVMNADGANQHEISSTGAASSPSWSPDGSRIVVKDSEPQRVRIYTDTGMPLGFMPGTNFLDEDYDPSWSPTGDRIAYARRPCEEPDTCLGDPTLWITKLDGSSNAPLGGTDAPDWFPNGQRLAFNSCFTDEFEVVHCSIVFLNADGTGAAVGTPEGFIQPAISPDGQRIAYTDMAEQDVYVDGVPVTTHPANDYAPSWQPIPIGYPRPRGASPTYASLVPAYAPCTAPTNTHGAPLSFPSCTPSQSSSELTVGTPDANARGANSVGYVMLAARAGNPNTPADEADVRVTSSVTDVRYRVGLADYTGELGLRLPLQITDRNNTGAGPATVQATEIGLSIPCTATSATTTGATCAIVTTIEAAIPGAIAEETRSVWELGRIRVDDGGPDGDADTPGNGTFAVQGVFVP